MTDNGQHILDVTGLQITDPLALESQINQWPGVVTVGIFAHQKAQVCLLGTAPGRQDPELLNGVVRSGCPPDWRASAHPGGGGGGAWRRRHRWVRTQLPAAHRAPMLPGPWRVPGAWRRAA